MEGCYGGARARQGLWPGIGRTRRKYDTGHVQASDRTFIINMAYRKK